MSGDSSQPIVPVLDLGAKGDGNADDRKAIRAAVDSAHGSAATVFYPPNIHQVNQFVLREGSAPRTVDAAQTGNAIAGGDHGDR